MDNAASTAEFLTSRRARLGPAETGLADDGRQRRVPGLKRDEVARLAHISTEYYTRLEQGRARNPSPEVVAGLVKALGLNHSERAYLEHLLKGGSAAEWRPAQRVRKGMALMMDSLSAVPAFIVGRRLDVLEQNALSREVMGDIRAAPPADRNLARYCLLDPSARERIRDWERIAAETVAVLRYETGLRPDDRALAALVGDLREGCPEFAGWWDDHAVLRRTHGRKYYRHAEVGDLDFHYESFEAPGDADQTLCVYNAEPGSATAERLAFLRMKLEAGERGAVWSGAGRDGFRPMRSLRPRPGFGGGSARPGIDLCIPLWQKEKQLDDRLDGSVRT
ncbi:helix-turn-helix domain-containing protein [Salininema proteolyticum]|uniref:Helix-turn-helix domain-containing protein n=1 Tax=Salininema proteolyticum TaxID=1607685 RepID=A0ABV8U080_9ACTN